MVEHLKRDKVALVSAVVIAGLVLAAVLAPLVAPYDPLRIDLDHLRLGPSWQHWMGTDNKGRDIFSRVLFGARVSLLTGLAACAVSMAIGISLGVFGGYMGGKVDAALSSLTDMVMAFPSLLLAIVIVAILGPGIMNAMLAVADAGLDLSVDLMCGIPSVSPSLWRASLEAVVECGATHVSVYPLSVEPGTPLASAVEAGELHLDVARGVERELPRLEWRLALVRSRGVLDDHGLVALNEGVDEELVGAGREVEVLERVDVDRDRDRGEVGRDIGLVDDDPLDPAGAVRHDLATALVAIGDGLLQQRPEEVEHVLAAAHHALVHEELGRRLAGHVAPPRGTRARTGRLDGSAAPGARGRAAGRKGPRRLEEAVEVVDHIDSGCIDRISAIAVGSAHLDSVGGWSGQRCG